MHLVVMIIKGTIEAVPHPTGHASMYKNFVRPNAKSFDGHAICEVVLDNGDGEISAVPQRAELQFMRVVKFEDGISGIELYDGSQLVMKFKPLRLGDQ